MTKKTKPILAIDFDGTIVDFAFPEIGKLKPGAKEAIKKLSKKYHIVISSCRASSKFLEDEDRDYIYEMFRYLKDNGIPFDDIDRGRTGKVIVGQNGHYIDDRAIEFKSWDKIVKRLL